MKTHKDFIHITTQNRVEIVDITRKVRKICEDSGIQEGIALVFPHHTSSAVYVSDSDTGITSDLRDVLEKIVPQGDNYIHNQADSKRNADAHLKATLIGHHIVIPISKGAPDLGQYQTIYYAEFDGMREKEILVKVIGDR